eukprot:scaffold37540_cov28-Tisochrysis_lutea.AAC.4
MCGEEVQLGGDHNDDRAHVPSHREVARYTPRGVPVACSQAITRRGATELANGRRFRCDNLHDDPQHVA